MPCNRGFPDDSSQASETVPQYGIDRKPDDATWVRDFGWAAPRLRCRDRPAARRSAFRDRTLRTRIASGRAVTLADAAVQTQAPVTPEFNCSSARARPPHRERRARPAMPSARWRPGAKRRGRLRGRDRAAGAADRGQGRLPGRRMSLVGGRTGVPATWSRLPSLATSDHSGEALEKP